MSVGNRYRKSNKIEENEILAIFLQEDVSVY